MPIEAVPSHGGIHADLKAALRARHDALASPPPAAATEIDDNYDIALTAAAVSSFFDPDDLADRISPLAAREVMARLGRECLSTIRDDRRVWLIRGQRRRARLAELAAKGDLRRAVSESRIGREDELTTALAAYVGGEARPVAEQSLAELAASERATTWLEGLVASLPDPSEIRAVIDREELLRPLREVAGTETHFAGRRAELARLRSFVGVLDPTTARERAIAYMRSRLGYPSPVATCVSGVGGAGKSALLARFILDHVHLDDPRQLPFSYLDFDRPAIQPGDVGSLGLEILRQLCCQYPAASNILSSELEALRDRYLSAASDATEETVGRNADLDSAEAGRDPRIELVVDHLARSLRRLDVSDRPFLLVLDTYEEAEYLSAANSSSLLRFLNRLRHAVPTLSLVISGRTPPHGFPHAEQIVLTSLDRESAIGYLVARGLDEALASQVFKQVGGLPLALRLAGELIVRDGAGPAGVDDLQVRHWFWGRFKDDLVLAQLYRRILEHIHDPDVRRIAHPGLVVRRIDPAMIREVIGPACGFEPTDHEAARLYEALRTEVTLVIDEGTHLRHRPDIRAEMLDLMARDAGHLVASIHERAILHLAAAYGRSGDPRDRSDEIYHRLMIGGPFEEIRRLWIPEAASHLRSVVDELPQEAAARLSLLLGAVPEAEGMATTAAEMVEGALARAGAYMREGRLEEALSELRRLGHADPGDARPALLHADALGRSLLWEEALAILSNALARYPGDRRVRCAHATAMFRLGLLEETLQSVLAWAANPSGEEDLAAFLELSLVGLACARLLDRTAAASALSQGIGTIVERLSDDELRDHPHLLRRDALLRGDRDPATVLSFFRHVGLSNPSSAEMSMLAHAVTAWDVQASKSLGQRPGALARRVGIARAPEEDIGLAWTRFLGEASRVGLDDLLGRLLAASPMRPGDAAGFSEVIRFRHPEWREPAIRALDVAFPEMGPLTRLACEELGAFPGDLETFVGNEPGSAALVRWADAEGLLLELLEKAAILCPDRGLRMVHRALHQWLLACAPKGIGSAATGFGTPTKRTDAPGIPLFDLVRRYYEVAFVDRISFGREFGLIEDGDMALDVATLSSLILARAKERGLLSGLGERLGLSAV